jgi:hypothetical protein
MPEPRRFSYQHTTYLRCVAPGWAAKRVNRRYQYIQVEPTRMANTPESAAAIRSPYSRGSVLLLATIDGDV